MTKAVAPPDLQRLQRLFRCRPVSARKPSDSGVPAVSLHPVAPPFQSPRCNDFSSTISTVSPLHPVALPTGVCVGVPLHPPHTHSAEVVRTKAPCSRRASEIVAVGGKQDAL